MHGPDIQRTPVMDIVLFFGSGFSRQTGERPYPG
jgi:hypothetical protein